METLTIELNSPKARKLIDDLVDLGIISLKTTKSDWSELWNKLDKQLPQNDPDLTEADIMAEIKVYRQEQRAQQATSGI